jgi:hypothetical protein
MAQPRPEEGSHIHENSSENLNREGDDSTVKINNLGSTQGVMSSERDDDGYSKRINVTGGSSLRNEGGVQEDVKMEP